MHTATLPLRVTMHISKLKALRSPSQTYLTTEGPSSTPKNVHTYKASEGPEEPDPLEYITKLKEGS